MHPRSMFRQITATAVTIGVAFSSPAAFAKSHAAAHSASYTPPKPTATLSEPHMFAGGSPTLYTPDGLVVTKHYVFVAYQNASDHQPTSSIVARYDHNGKLIGTVYLSGRCDGLRRDPSTGLLWAVVNNDGLNGSPPRQPYVTTIVPRTLVTKNYAFPAVQPHGGGYDDVAFVNGQAFLSAASPTLTAAGIDDKPIIVKATLQSNGTIAIAPILYGNSPMYDANLGKVDIGNVSDPDSLIRDSKNRLVLVGDNDQDLVFVTNPGSKNQQVTRAHYATQFDDVVDTTGTSGRLWIVDSVTSNVMYIDATFPAGTFFGETGGGNPVSSFISTIDGVNAITPLLTQRDGIFSPTSLIFEATGQEDND